MVKSAHLVLCGRSIFIIVNTYDSLTLMSFSFQSIMTPLQGFLNCLIYGWIRGSFQRALNIGMESTLLSWSTRGGGGGGGAQTTLENTRFTDYGTLSNTDDDYETLSDGDSSKTKTLVKHNGQVTFSTSESGS